MKKQDILRVKESLPYKVYNQRKVAGKVDEDSTTERPQTPDPLDPRTYGQFTNDLQHWRGSLKHQS